MVRSGGFRSRLPSAVAWGVLALLLGVPMVSAQAPKLQSVIPANGTTEVAVDTSIVFKFDQAMDVGVELMPSFPPFLIGNFEVIASAIPPFYMGEWSEDGLTLTCTLINGELPGGTLVTWTLNPTGTQDPFVNEAGTPLAKVSGSFTTTGGGNGGGDEDCDGLPDSWGQYSLFKVANYIQSSAADPVPEPTDAFQFGATVMSPDGPAQVTAGSVTFPDSNVKDLEGFGGMFFLLDSADVETALEALSPPGAYVLRFTQMGQPERVISMTMPVNNVPVPKVLNYGEAQAVNASQNFTLRWNAFTGANADRDLLIVTVSEDDASGEVVFEAPDLCVPRELPVTATSVVIPAGTLTDGVGYTASLMFSRGFYNSTNAVPEMGGYGAISRVTTFPILAGSGGGPADPATLSDIRLSVNGKPMFQLTGTASRVYTIERTDDLTPTVQWTQAGNVTMDGGGQATFEDAAANMALPQFYRVVAP